MKRWVDRLRRWAQFIPLVLAIVWIPERAWSGPKRDRMPMTFVPSATGHEAGPRFEAQTLGGTLFFTPSGVVMALPRTPPGGRPGAARDLPASAAGAAGGVPVAIVHLRFLGAATKPHVEGAGRLPGVHNEFRGSDPARWRSRVPAYAGVVYRDLYPGIDLRYEGVEGRVKGTYVVAPGADPSRIRWAYAGARWTRVDEAGNLLIALRPGASGPASDAAAGGVMMEETPAAWQERAGRRSPVPVRYSVADDGSVGFALPAGYDPTEPLLLDPTLTYSTYVGGGGEDVGYAVAADASGTYVAGYTLSADFPTSGGVDTGCGTDGSCDGFAFYDVFVAKMDPAQTGPASLVFSTYLGGDGDDYGVRIAVDGAGASYVTGLARGGFPTTANAFRRIYGGAPGSDAFLAKLSADGSQLLYATYLGGTGGDGAWGIALDGSNNVYLAGQTASVDLPTTGGALDVSCGTDGTCNAASDAFVARVDPAASGAASLVFSTYLGGSGDDQAFGLARDGAANPYVVGRTLSTDFPLAGVPYQTSHGGDYDAFLAKLGPTATSLTYATYLGGSGYDDAYSVGVGPTGTAYLTGTSSSSTFPTTAGAFQTAFGGVYDAVFAQLDPTAAGAGSLLYATYLGGDDDDEGFGIAVDGAGIASLAGFTRSANFPTAGRPFQPLNGGAWDAFVAKVDPAVAGAGSLPYSTYLGGLGTDAAYGVALDPALDMHVTGQTLSANFPAAGGFQGSYQGNSDVFVAVIDAAARTADLAVVLTDSADPASIGQDLTYTVTVTNGGPDAAAGVRLADIVVGNAVFVSATPTQGLCTAVTSFAEQQVSCQLGALASGASATVDVVVNPGSAGTITNTAGVASNVGDADGFDNGAVESTTALDLIFADGFETGDTSRWSAVASDGDLGVTGAAALAGTTAGLQAAIDDTSSLHVEDQTPDDEARYRARFYFDPNGFDPGTAEGHFRTRILLALEDGPTRRIVAVVLRLLGGQYAIRARARLDDGTVADTPFIDITDAAHVVEIDWVRSSGEGNDDGSLQLWIDDIWVAALTGLDTDAHGVDTARLGALSVKEGASGTLFFDQFESRRQGYIGP